MTPGRHNAITDVPGIEVGHATDHEALTGTTVILARAGAVAGVDVRGAAPGTRETELLEPGNLVQTVQAIVLSGGSAFGLDAAGGVMRYLEEQGLGQAVGPGRVPIVPAAVIFDLDLGSWSKRPTAEFGYRAAEGASSGRPAMGNVGAGTGARAGGLKGGVGSASAILEISAGRVVVGALAVVNAVGRAHDPVTGALHGRALALGDEFNLVDGTRVAGPGTQGANDYADLFPTNGSLAGRNTTIGVVATDARLDKAQARKLSQMAHDGLARAIRPAHTMFDGDTIFALATGERELFGPAELTRLAAVASDAFTRAIVHGMIAAKGAGGFESYCEAYPERCGAGISGVAGSRAGNR
ncbi:MAG: P1 family peptidase [Trueperaceae bacterium]